MAAKGAREMSLFKGMFGGKTEPLSLETDPTTDSGLTKEAEKVVVALTWSKDFKGLERALAHPEPKVRAFVVGMIAIAGVVQAKPGGGVHFEMDAEGRPLGTCDPRALALLEKAAKDPDPAVRGKAQEEVAGIRRR
jgi:hypothetical protein